jgi:tripartite-type tricarboxylate transporter receptor subunit TctC
VISGEVPVLIDASLIIAPYVRTGKLKALAVTGPRRDPLLPQIPTLIESGLAVSGEAWLGLIAPARVPATIVQQMNEAVNAVLQESAFQTQLLDRGWHLAGGSVEDFEQFIRSEHTRWANVIRTSGLRVQ